MKKAKSIIGNAVQRMGIIICIISVALMGMSFTPEKVLVLSGSGYEMSIEHYLPSGERVRVPNGCKREVVGFDSCMSAVRLWGSGWTTNTRHSEKRIKVGFKSSYFKRQEKMLFAVAPVLGLRQKRILVIHLKYPYGKSQIYMGGSTISVMARFKHMGYEVDYLDLNFDPTPGDDIGSFHKAKNADIIAISVTGAPYVPSLIDLTWELSHFGRGKQILLGGQVIERLDSAQFESLFGSKMFGNVKQIVTDADFAKALDCTVGELPNPYAISFVPAWESIGNERLKKYLSNEMTLVLSQGCHFQCAFCAASKAEREKFKMMDCFSTDLLFLTSKAKEFGLKELQFYATSLDFFQNPKIVAGYLEEVGRIQSETGIKIKIRCLCCASSFLHAAKVVGELRLKTLIQESGLWCIGFGVDGADADVWKAQKKRQNNLNEIKDCLDLATRMNIRSEILLVMGFPQDTLKTLAKCVINSVRYVSHWPNIMLRPYLAKELVPGNDGWKSGNPAVNTFISDPKKFYNLDFCAIGSKSTHPSFMHRMWSNLSYLTIIGIFTPLGKCCTSPLLPQGDAGLYGRFAKFFNRIVPMDR